MIVTEKDKNGVEWVAEHFTEGKQQFVAIYRHYGGVPYVTYRFEKVGDKLEALWFSFPAAIESNKLCREVLKSWVTAE